MALTVAQFKANFPEFEDTPDATVSGYLERAKKYWPAEVLGDLHDEAVGLQTAILATSSPLGLRARPASKARSEYLERLDDLLALSSRRLLAIY